MAATLILMLPDDGPIRIWWRVDQSMVVDSGQDGEWADFAMEDGAGPTIALAPAAAVPVRWHHLPELTPPQAAAAARIQAIDAVLGTADERHVAVGLPGADAMVAVAVVAHDDMRRWRALMDAAGLDARALIPVAALVPMPGEGRAMRAEIGGTDLLRTADLCAEADAALDPLRIGGAPCDAATPDQAAAWLATLEQASPVNLLTGDYAPRPPAMLDAWTRGWLVRLTAALALLTLAVPLVQAWQYARGINAADARTVAAAAGVGERADDAAAAETAIDRRLAERGGGPLALSAPLGGLYQSLNDHPEVAVRTLAHAGNGTLSVTLASPRIDDVNAVLKALQARGYTITAQPLQGSDGMRMGNVTIRAVP